MSKKSTSVRTAATLGKVLRYLQHYRLLFALSLLMAVVVVGLTLYLPVLTGEAIDLIIAPGQVDFDGIAPILLRAAVAIAITALAQWIMNVCNNRITSAWCAVYATMPSSASSPCPSPTWTAAPWATRSAA